VSTTFADTGLTGQLFTAPASTLYIIAGASGANFDYDEPGLYFRESNIFGRYGYGRVTVRSNTTLDFEFIEADSGSYAVLDIIRIDLRAPVPSPAPRPTTPFNFADVVKQPAVVGSIVFAAFAFTIFFFVLGYEKMFPDRYRMTVNRMSVQFESIRGSILVKLGKTPSSPAVVTTVNEASKSRLELLSKLSSNKVPTQQHAEP
jgi:hypothetical protein